MNVNFCFRVVWTSIPGVQSGLVRGFVMQLLLVKFLCSWPTLAEKAVEIVVSYHHLILKSRYMLRISFIAICFD